MPISSDLLSGKVVVVTGGAGLLGRTFISAIVGAGGTGVIADINEETGLKTRDTLKRELNSDTIDFVKLDITSKDSINQTIGLLAER